VPDVLGDAVEDVFHGRRGRSGGSSGQQHCGRSGGHKTEGAGSADGVDACLWGCVILSPCFAEVSCTTIGFARTGHAYHATKGLSGAVVGKLFFLKSSHNT
jgi:hypothetical protein